MKSLKDENSILSNQLYDLFLPPVNKIMDAVHRMLMLCLVNRNIYLVQQENLVNSKKNE